EVEGLARRPDLRLIRDAANRLIGGGGAGNSAGGSQSPMNASPRVLILTSRKSAVALIQSLNLRGALWQEDSRNDEISDDDKVLLLLNPN
ncbi:MAG: hypothetical protein AAF483_08745, partial [Planctomycetota bacterium]